MKKQIISWGEKYIELKSYVGKIDIIYKLVSLNNLSLFNWCMKQRIAYKSKKLSKEQIEKLEELPFWSWEKKSKNTYVLNEKLWLKRYNELRIFIIKNKRLPRQNRFSSTHEWKLYMWCFAQRRAMTQKDRSGSMTQNRVDLLEALPIWRWENRKNKKFGKETKSLS